MVARKGRIDPPEFVERMFKNPIVPGRRVCFTAVDWKDFGDAFAESLPDAWYTRNLTLEEARQVEPPAIPRHKHLCDVREPDGVFAGEVEVHLHADWNPRVVETGTSWKKWDITSNLEIPRIRVLLSRGIQPADKDSPEHLDESEIQIYCESGNKNHARFVRQVFRLIERLATNRNQLVVSYPDYQILNVIDKGSWCWFGRDALRWVREDQKRMFNYYRPKPERNQPGMGCRPNDNDTVSRLAEGSG
jgi:hypothetical protein